MTIFGCWNFDRKNGSWKFGKLLLDFNQNCGLQFANDPEFSMVMLNHFFHYI